MNDASAVRRGQRPADLPNDRFGCLLPDFAGTGHQGGERPASHILHNYIGCAIGKLAQSVDTRDIGMVDTGGRAGLTLKTLFRSIIAGSDATQSLYCDKALEIGFLGKMHDAHGTAAKQPGDLKIVELQWT